MKSQIYESEGTFTKRAGTTFKQKDKTFQDLSGSIIVPLPKIRPNLEGCEMVTPISARMCVEWGIFVEKANKYHLFSISQKVHHLLDKAPLINKK